MKNIFKLMAVALMACSLTVACGDKDNDEDNPVNPDPETPGTIAINFDGQTLNMGWFDALTAESQGEQVWLLQAASRAEGTTVYFPYVVEFMMGAAADQLEITDCELYKDTYYEASGNQYGDWQYYETNNFDVVALDLNARKMSVNQNISMYYLTELVEDTTGTVTEETATHKNLVINVTNYVFEEATE